MVQRIRLRYAKRGPLRFASHRDFARAFERALRRAGVPIAFSAGFSPHPKVSYVGAAPTGTSSEAEYLEIGLAEHVDPDDVRRALDTALPAGFAVLDAVQARTPDFAARVDASRWLMQLPGVAADELADVVRRFLALDEAFVERTTKAGRKLIDARAAVVDLRVDRDARAAVPDPAVPGATGAGPTGAAKSAGVCGTLVMVVRQTTPAVRPDDVLAALRATAGLQRTDPVASTRLAQGRLDAHGVLADPLEPDRAVAEGYFAADSPATGPGKALLHAK